MKWFRAVLSSFDVQSAWIRGGIVGLLFGLIFGTLSVTNALGDSSGGGLLDAVWIGIASTFAGMFHATIRRIKRHTAGRVLAWIMTSGVAMIVLMLLYGEVDLSVDSLALLLGLSLGVGVAISILEWHWRRW